MKNTKNILGKAGVLLLATFVLTSFVTIAETTTNFTSTTATPPMSSLPKDEVEISYYDPATLTHVIGLQGPDPPFYWASGIRLTQDELKPFKDWEMTKVVVALTCDEQTEVFVDLKIYGEGTPTQPGSLIYEEDDLYYDATGLYTIDLNTSILIGDHDEIWVTMWWEQLTSGVHIPYADDGPAVDGKGDWGYLNNAWSELQGFGLDYNWGMGAIVEGEGIAEITIQNVKGPIGIKADIKNIGTVTAEDLEYTISITGGILGMINKTTPGTLTELTASGVAPISSGIVFGLGKIAIQIKVVASNAWDAVATFEAIVLGPLVIGIK